MLVEIESFFKFPFLDNLTISLAFYLLIIILGVRIQVWVAINCGLRLLLNLFVTDGLVVTHDELLTILGQAHDTGIMIVILILFVETLIILLAYYFIFLQLLFHLLDVYGLCILISSLSPESLDIMVWILEDRILLGLLINLTTIVIL